MPSRKLVAIMFTDIAGYTALMGKDEDRAVAALQRSRAVVTAQVAKHGGTILDNVGDGTLSSFESAVSAVECAREIQTQIGSDDFELRIGIHIGDVLVSEDGVMGDGVNVASRIHGLAGPGSIAISDRVYDDVRNHPDLQALPLGERDLKNVNRRISVYVLAAPGAAPTAEHAAPGRGRRGFAWAAGIGAAALLGLGGVLWLTGTAERLFVRALIQVPLWLGGDVEQQIAFTRSADGTRIAYASAGKGEGIVHVLGWASHVERGVNSAAYNPSVAHFARSYRFVHYDGRGTGLSDRNVKDYSIDARVADLEAVIDALGFDRVVLMGLSAGGWPSLEYTLRHPEKVRRLILIATAANAPAIREANPAWETIPDMIRASWGQTNSAGHQMFMSLVSPSMTNMQREVVSELFSVATSGEDAANFLEGLLEFDFSDRLEEISVPTLVIHARGDLLVPFEAGGRELAAGIPGAKLLVLETDAHAIPPRDPTYPEMITAIDAFLAEDPELAEAR